MNNIDLQKLSKLISQKTGEEITVESFEKIGSGYHSDGYKLMTSNRKAFFLKYVRSHDLGFEFPERQIMSLMVSDGMSKRVESNPASTGVIISSDESEIVLPDLNNSTKVYHVQELGDFEKSYLTLLEENKDKTKVDEKDIKLLESIADVLLKIHSVKHDTKDEKHLTALYNDGIRNVLTHPELSMMVLSEFPEDYPILDLEGQKEIIGLMYENIKSWNGRFDRLTALHGDFWGANIFLNNNGEPFVIDFSRIPWGDPAIDVGWFIAPFLWKYHATGNQYYKELTEAWLDIYEKKSGDAEVRKAICLVVGWTGIVQIYPRWFPGIEVEMSKKFITHIMDILRRKEFFWND
jgi:fructosamine-3-kinase